MSKYTDHELQAYLDEVLDARDMAGIESALRSDPNLFTRLVAVHQQREQGSHTLGEIWRRHRLSCPTREELGSFLLEALERTHADYVYFHITEIGCRRCQANLRDLEQEQQRLAREQRQVRRQRYFQTSARLLPGPA